MESLSQARLTQHLQTLTVDIGVRLAGTPGERRAADYIAESFAGSGAVVTVEPFPVMSRDVSTEHLDVHIAGRWHRHPCSLFANTPGTEGQPVEAPLVFFETPAEWPRTDLAHLRGKAVVHLGCHIESREAYQRLIAAEPAFLIFVDVRYPGSVPLADGMFPAYTHAIGSVPTVNAAFQDAWAWRQSGADAARLTVVGGMRRSESQNVIAELPGSEPDGGIITFGAHHDTQADSVGADDNASGAAGLLELARVLAPLPRRQSLRLVSFGTEEQLSVGSAEYVRGHRKELNERGRLMINLDSFGSWLGWTEVVCNGPTEVERSLANEFAVHGLFAKFIHDIVPYADHFPFVAAGVPGVYIGRANCAGGRFFHHRPDDDMSRVSPELMSRLLTAVATWSTELAAAKTWPFPSEIPADQAEAVRIFWEDLFGGWAGVPLE